MPITLLVPAAAAVGRMALQDLPCLVSTEPIAQLPTLKPTTVTVCPGTSASTTGPSVCMRERERERERASMSPRRFCLLHTILQPKGQGETREGGTRALALRRTADFSQVQNCEKFKSLKPRVNERRRGKATLRGGADTALPT
jgi:hypothetical protein